MEPKTELIGLLNEALKMEHAAAVQYLAHAEQITGPAAEPLMARLQDSAKDEQGHAEKLRSLISDYLLGQPTMDFAPGRMAAGLPDILETNIATEKDAIELYKRIRVFILEHGSDFPLEAETLDFDINEILREEQEHVAELVRLK